ncbi:MAG: diguanylate cyclase [Ruminococcaceae bacterium]|nr:diguanylate cyclase [Oscillospiraceae bacterium]
MQQQPSRVKRQSERNVTMTLKILILYLCAIPVLQKVLTIISKDETETMIVSFSKMLTFFSIILAIALFWVITNYVVTNKRIRSFVEVSALYGMCLLCYLSTGISTSNYKFIFALIVLMYSMELGMKFGMCMSLVSGLSIVAGDLLSCSESMRSQMFQSDLILFGSFCLLAYIVGFFSERNRKLIEELKDSVNRDSLTHLFNHRYFYEYMHGVMDAPVEGMHHYILMMDIDFFKAYNDTLGHPKGDAVLVQISNICRNLFSDRTVFRYGGEEFAITYTATDAQEAVKIADHLRTTIAMTPFEGEHLLPGHNLTVSIGVAELQVNDTLTNWIERADNALYKAKAFHKNRVQLYSSVHDRFEHLDSNNDDERIVSIKTLLSVINSRDRYTYNHTDRVVHYCETYAKYAKMSESQQKMLLYSAYLHDIGKINVPQEILISEKKLTPEEWEQIKKHPVDSAEIVRGIRNFGEIAKIVRQHHEKFDGSGYPDGKTGTEIHYLARVLALADSFDAMTSKRPYQRAKSFEEAFEEIRRCKGTHFDPDLAEVFIQAIQTRYVDDRSNKK